MAAGEVAGSGGAPGAPTRDKWLVESPAGADPAEGFGDGGVAGDPVKAAGAKRPGPLPGRSRVGKGGPRRPDPHRPTPGGAGPNVRHGADDSPHRGGGGGGGGG